jgi:uncharacterized protein YjiS (DUF1127 family)
MHRFVIGPEAPQARRPAARVRAAQALAAWSQRLAERLQLWRDRNRQREALRALNDHMLKDLGLSHADAARESGKRFWEI